MGLAAGAGAAVSPPAGWDSLVSFLLQAARRIRAMRASALSMANDVFVMRMCTFRGGLVSLRKLTILSRTSGYGGGPANRLLDSSYRFFRSRDAGSRAAHRRCHAALLFRSELEDVVDQQLGVVLIVAFERRRGRTCEHPMVVHTVEQSRWHRCARTNGLRIGDPTLHPVGLETLLGQQEIRCRSVRVMLCIAGRMALQTRRRCARKQAACHLGFLRGKRGHLLRDIRHGLLRDRLEEAHQLAQFVVGERERWHADFEVRAYTIAVVIGVA